MKIKKEGKRILSYVLLAMILVSLFPAGNALAADPYVNDGYINDDYVNDDTQFPVFPAHGSVNIDKKSDWVDDDIAEITLSLQGRPAPTPIDVVLILDRTTSMNTGRCTNPAHYTDYTYVKEVTYQVNYNNSAAVGNAGWTTVTDIVTITLRYHLVTGGTGWGELDSIFSSGYRTTMGSDTSPSGNDGTGAQIYYYRRSATDTGTWGPGVWNTDTAYDVDFRNFIRSVGGINPGFGDSISINQGVQFPPTSADWTPGLGVYNFTTGGCYRRIQTARIAGQDFVDVIFSDYADGSPSQNRMAVIHFGDDAVTANESTGGLSQSGSLYGNTDPNIAYLKKFINDMPLLGGTNYVKALAAAYNILNSRTEDAKQTRPAFVVFMSDGEPGIDNGLADNTSNVDGTGYRNITTARDNLEGIGATIYTVGLSITAANGDEILRKMSTGRSYYNRYYPVKFAPDLNGVFVSIANQIKATATNAVIYDELSTYFDYYEDADHIASVTAGTLLPNTTSDSGNAVLNWDLGNITGEVATLTYYVKIKDGYSYNDFPTNTEAYVDYTNYLDNECRYYFPVPSVNHDSGPVSVKIEYYKDSMDEEGYIDVETVVGLVFGETYTITEDLKLLYLPAGYKFENMNPATGSVVLTAGDNVIKVFYTRRDDIKYVINYYKDEITEANFLDSDSFEGRLYSEIEPNTSKYVPDGYVTPGAVSGATIITAVEEDNVVNVVYSKRTDLSVTIKYYQDTMDEDGYMGADKDETVEGLTFEATYTITEALRDQYLPDGSKFDSMAPSSGSVVVGVSGNVINVLYTKRGDLSATVKYYQDTMDEDGYMGADKDETVDGLMFGATYTINETLRDLYLPEGYKFGSTDPASGSIIVGVSGNVIKVLYAKRTDIPYVVNYYTDEISAGNFLDKVDGMGTLGAAIPANLSLYAPDGYATPGARSGATVITPVDADNVVNVVYSKRGDIPYVVNYYTDEISADNFLDNVDGTGTLDAAIPADLSLYAPDGYATPGTRSGATVITAVDADNVVNVVYSKRTDIPYVVNYYTDEISAGNLLDKVEGTGTLDAAIPANLSLYAPTGYATPGTRYGATVITAVDADNVVNVVYSKRGDIPYVVNYYKDDISADNFLDNVDGTGTLGADIPADLTLYAPDGYATSGTRSGATVITAVDADNVVNVVYSKRTDIPYVVNYYTDEISAGNFLDKNEGTGTLGANIPADLSLYAPDGYATPGTRSGATVITPVDADNVVNVVYSKRGDIPYVVNYYFSAFTDTKEYLDKVEGTGTLGDAINADLTLFVPAGYATPGARSGAEFISAIEADNVVEIVYSKRNDIPFVVNFYKDEIAEENLLQRSEDKGTLGALIGVNLEMFAPDGYATPGTRTGATFITAVEADNVVNVVYSKRTDIPYVVNYYTDEISDGNFLDKIEGTGTLDAAIPANLSLYAPDGYATPGTRTGADNITPVAADNMVNVVYAKRTDLTVTIKFYQDTMDDTGYMGADKDVVSTNLIFGATYEITTSTRDHQLSSLPAGYTFDRMEPASGSITVGVNENVIRILYTKSMFTITFKPGTNADFEPDAQLVWENCYYDQQTTPLAPYPYAYFGYKFIGWQDEKGNVYPPIVDVPNRIQVKLPNVTGSATYTALWVKVDPKQAFPDSIPSTAHFDKFWGDYGVICYAGNTTKDGDYFVVFADWFFNRYRTLRIGFGTSNKYDYEIVFTKDNATFYQITSSGRNVLNTGKTYGRYTVIDDGKYFTKQKNYNYGTNLLGIKFNNLFGSGAKQAWLY